MESKAWSDVQSNRLPVDIPTMLTGEERCYLYWLGKTCWSGRGRIVEIGPWLGGSTACLAAGMRASGRSAEKKLEVYDNFIWRDFMAARADLPLTAGASFEPFFLRYTEAFANIIDAKARSLPDENIPGNQEAAGKRFQPAESVPLLNTYDGDPVEILFIDGAKSWRGMRHLLLLLAPFLLPGVTLIVCQDYKYWGTHWVPLTMNKLGAHVEPVHNVLGGTTVTFRLLSTPASDEMARWPDHIQDLPVDEALPSIEEAASLLERQSDRAGALNVRLGKVSFLAHRGEWASAAECFGALQARWPLSVPTVQMERAREYLRTEHALTFPRPVRLRIADRCRYHLHQIRRRASRKNA